jgi:diguanylate cyclase (GGDEF)-like protein/PAS domain S-box-containing protein
LKGNRGVSAVRVTSGKTTLAQLGSTPLGLGSSIVRPIYSPINAAERVGEVTLYIDRAQIHADASGYSRQAILAMILQAALVALAVLIAVHVVATRPIKAVSNELHQIRSDPGKRLRVPRANRFDEIGTLVADVNDLIGSLAGLVSTERDLRIAHEESERKMRLIFEKSETGLFVVDNRGVLESWNPAFVRLLRLAPEQVVHPGVTALQLLLAPHAARVSEMIRDCVTSGQSKDLDLEMATDASIRPGWVEVSLKPIGPNALQGVVNDVTERKQGELFAHERATQDSLTGLLNRHGLDVGIAAAFSGHSAGSAPELAFLQIDLDLFKEVNDGYGHQSGDQVLRQVARILQRNARRGDLIARYGGDEFVVVLTGIADPSKAEQIAKSIIAEIKRPIDIGGRSVQIGASIGIAFACPGDSPGAVMDRADTAMYAAKKAGRSQVCLASDPLVPPDTSAVA